MMISTNPAHSKISPTAKLVAYWRQFSDVPYAKEVSDLIHAREVSEEILQSAISLENMAWLAPMIEARYKSLGSAVRREGIKQVLELASGVALRGLTMAADPEMVYVESDLEEISEEKKRLVEKIRTQQDIPIRKNLFYETVNVLVMEDLDLATRHFSISKPVAVIHEGLMPYLSLPEKEILARNIHSILSKFGGVWITPDFTTKSELEKNWNRNEEFLRMTQAVGKLTGRSFKDAAFENDEHVMEFCDRMGFEVKVTPQIDGSYQLTAAQKIQVPDEVFKSYLSQLKLWTLKLKS